AALNAGFIPFTRELGSLGTGDLTTLADIALSLVGEGQAWLGEELVAAEPALHAAGIAPVRLGPRDGLAFMSSNAVSVGHAALLVVDTRAVLDTWLTVAAMSFEAAAADPAVSQVSRTARVSTTKSGSRHLAHRGGDVVRGCRGGSGGVRPAPARRPSSGR